MVYRWTFAMLLVCACTWMSGCGGGGGSAVSPTPIFNAPVVPTATSPTIKLALFGNLSSCPESWWPRYGIHVGGEYDAKLMAAFKAAIPGARVFLYQIAGAANDAEWAKTVPNDPIGYYWIDENRPEWFLLDTEGNRISFTYYPNVWAIDIGDRDYQQMWAEKAVERASRIGADGVWIDYIMYHYDWAYKVIPAKYPTTAVYTEAVTSFVHNVAPVVRASGLLTVANGGTEPWSLPPWPDWIQYFDGRNYEPPGGCLYAKYENEQLWRDLLAGYTGNPDKLYIHCLPHPQMFPGEFRFAVASFLLWMGSDSYAAAPWSNDPQPIYDPLLDVSIGQPTGQCQQLGATTYKRTFEQGEVYINISATVSEAVEVGEGFCEVSDGSQVTGTVTLAPHQSLILAKK